jgi:hypothetical protein
MEVEMPNEQEIQEAGRFLKRAARELDDAARRQTWDEAKRDIDSAATNLRRAGDELEK